MAGVGGKISTTAMLKTSPELGSEQHSRLRLFSFLLRLTIWAIEVWFNLVVISSNRFLDLTKLGGGSEDLRI
jgi:hypothetical protein